MSRTDASEESLPSAAGGVSARVESSARVIRDLMRAVASTRSLEEICDRALRSVCAAAAVNRAAILLFDDEGVMRFVAWQGLSDAYRQAVEGHSPWAKGAVDPPAIVVPDVRADVDLASYRPIFEDERIASLAFIPIWFADRLLGKFMLYDARPRRFNSDEVGVAEALAGCVGFALEHHRMRDDLTRQLEAEHSARQWAEEEERERQRSQARMLESDESLHLALAAGHMGLWRWDLATNRVEWSPELEALHGLEAGTFAGNFEAFQSDMHPEDRQRVPEAIQEALAAPDEPYIVEYRIVLPSGETRWVSSRGRVVCDAEGRPKLMLGVCGDITERKREEQRQAFIIEANRLLSSSIDREVALRSLAQLAVPNIADWCAIHLAAADGELELAHLAHVEPEKIAVARDMLDRWPLHRDVRGLREVFRTRTPRLVGRIEPTHLKALAHDPAHLARLEALSPSSIMAVPLVVGTRCLGVISLLSSESRHEYGPRDLEIAQKLAGRAAITLDHARLLTRAEASAREAELARRQVQLLAEASQKLADSLDPRVTLERLARFCSEHLADYCVTYDLEGTRIRRVGLAHRCPEMEEQLRAFQDIAPPSTTDDFGIGKVVRTGEPIFRRGPGDQRLDEVPAAIQPMVSGSPIEPTSLIVVPLQARGRVIGALALVNTSRSEREFEARDLDLAEQLASRAALLVDNAHLYQAAHESLRAQDEMLGVVSHDLRNPLNTIAMAAALLDSDLPPERKARSQASISRAAKQMERLINDLLDVSRLETGGFSLACEALGVGELIDEAISLFLPLAESQDVTLERVVDEPLPVIQADHHRLLQVLSNLVGNALRFTPEGGQVRLIARPHGDGVMLAVSDDGPGIHKDHQERIFDRFWRGSGENRGGAGLGLAIARGIVEAHGGTIAVESEPPAGSTFRFTIPASADSGPISKRN